MTRNLLKFSRALHLYTGVFITPALLFFALTGALQTFGLHETNRDHPDYKPAHWIVVLGQIHKKQTAILPVRKPPQALPASVGDAGDKGKVKPAPAPAIPAQTPPATPPSREPHPLPLRIFFLVVCLGLLTSTVTGLYMSYKYARNRTLVTLVLVAGIVVPVLLLLV